jgi:hypothetical protein
MLYGTEHYDAYCHWQHYQTTKFFQEVFHPYVKQYLLFLILNQLDTFFKRILGKDDIFKKEELMFKSD